MAEREIELLKKGTEEHLKQLYLYVNFCKDVAVSIEEQVNLFKFNLLESKYKNNTIPKR